MKHSELCDRLAAVIGAEFAGNSQKMAKIDSMLWVLYPDGIQPHEYADAVVAVRILDRLCAATESHDKARSVGVMQPTAAQRVEPQARPWTDVGPFSLHDALEKNTELARYYEILAGQLLRNRTSA
ncbi:MAG: hypothetical protein MJE77_36370 [Proteobacteria bacterium]|nr:hypothetical protein [Pseudomonadota bacterium]